MNVVCVSIISAACECKCCDFVPLGALQALESMDYRRYGTCLFCCVYVLILLYFTPGVYAMCESIGVYHFYSLGFNACVVWFILLCAIHLSTYHLPLWCFAGATLPSMVIRCLSIVVIMWLLGSMVYSP